MKGRSRLKAKHEKYFRQHLCRLSIFRWICYCIGKDLYFKSCTYMSSWGFKSNMLKHHHGRFSHWDLRWGKKWDDNKELWHVWKHLIDYFRLIDFDVWLTSRFFCGVKDLFLLRQLIASATSVISLSRETFAILR